MLPAKHHVHEMRLLHIRSTSAESGNLLPHRTLHEAWGRESACTPPAESRASRCAGSSSHRALLGGLARGDLGLHDREYLLDLALQSRELHIEDQLAWMEDHIHLWWKHGDMFSYSLAHATLDTVSLDCVAQDPA